jgi:hypothetical protein
VLSRALVVLGLAGVVLEAGCAWIWVMSPQLTGIYNAEFTARFFERLPGLGMLELGVLGLIGEAAQDVTGMVVRLEVGLGLMIVGYLGGLWALERVRGARGAGWLVLGGAIVFRLTMLLLPGLFSTDVFSYVMYGRIAGLSGQNPYVVAPSSFPNDPFLGWVFPFWRDQPTVYGPLWTDFSWLLARLTGGLSNFDQVAVYRGSLAVIEAATLGMLWWVLGRLRRDERGSRARMSGWAMYAWNPLVLFDLVGGAHNDVAMLALLLVGVGAIVNADDEQKPTLPWVVGLLAMSLGALVKYATGLVTLLWAVAWAAQGGTTRVRVIRLALGLGLPLLLAASLWWPWLETSQAFLPLSDAASGRLVINSAPDLIALTVADQALAPHGMERETAQAVTRFWARMITRTLFAAYLFWEMWRLWQRPAVLETVRASARVLLVLPLLVMTWVWSWYFSWSLALAALLGGQSRLARLVVGYALCALPVVYAHQYLNEGLPGAFVALFALAPLLTVLAVTRGSSDRRRSRSPYPRASDSQAGT